MPLFIISFAVWLGNSGRIKTQSKAIATLSPIYRQLEVPKGKKARLVLPDGTLVYLNSATQISYPEKFSSGPRIVRISGEAYFKVVKDEAHPFIIEMPQTKITVIGTAFNVKAYPADPATTVVVEEGKVRFTAATSEREKCSLPDDI
ncbi:FecR family protein [Chitinophaga sp. S165]|uniref:FecR family protein n=1 Tax=Chitinophaga sp. S165 TaxID=2135462 RepID=UPI000D89846E|nr:FecR family protein [Chitinophaga sp. S165]PWV49593.1 FecR family protein [Chitinophaga sp. S165]